MYIIFLQGSPWEKSVSFFPNSVLVLARPVELRKASALKVLGFLFPFARFLVFMGFTLCHCVHPSGGLYIAYYANRNESRSMTIKNWIAWLDTKSKTAPRPALPLACDTSRDCAVSSSMAKTATNSSKVRP